MENTVYPWLSDVDLQLGAYIKADKVPHAIMISGCAGIGKRALTRSFAKRLLCESETCSAHGCHQCQSCLLFEAGNHPDYYLLQPLEAAKQILVDEVRQLNQNLKLHPQYTQYRVVVIILAEQLNMAAANSFLKTLEEPGQRTVFLLVSNTPSSVMPTILSRCQQIRIAVPSLEHVTRWLEQSQHIEDARSLAAFSGAAPLLAVELYSHHGYEHRLAVLKLFDQNAFALSMIEAWAKYSNEFVVYTLMTGTMDMIRLAMDPGIQANALYLPDQKKQLGYAAASTSVKSLFGFLKQLYRAKQLLATQVNMQLVFESCYIHWRTMQNK